MKILNVVACFAMFFLSWPSPGTIIEIESIEQIKEFIDADTLVVFDLDGTLIAPSQMKAEPLGQRTLLSLLKQTIAEFQMAVCWFFSSTVVEDATISLIEDRQKAGIFVIGLTSRPALISSWTKRQLDRLNINFSGAPHAALFFGPLSPDSCKNFRHGIIFAGLKMDKGNALKVFLDQTEQRFSRVIFIDNEIRNVVSVEHALIDSGIDFVGFYYRSRINDSMEERTSFFTRVARECRKLFVPEKSYKPSN